MLKHWQTHQEYINFLHEAKIHFDSSQRLRLQTVFAPAREKLRLLNLDPVMQYLAPLYPNEGRPAKNQTQILRSLVLFFLINGKASCCGLTAWVEQLKNDPLLAALIGCAWDSLPPIGSYFDFMDRLWGSHDEETYSRLKLFPADKNKSRPAKPSKKGEKAPERHKDIVEKIVSRIERDQDLPFNFEETLQNLLLIAAVRPSRKLGLIPEDNLTVSGDGTCVHTHSNPFGKRLGPSRCGRCSECSPQSSCPRHYSDPDAHWGWDSDLEKFYFGHTLYTLSVYNEKDQLDLPLLVRFTSAARHDSVTGVVALQELHNHARDISPRNVCLDSAHDNYATYRLLNGWGIRPFIDLNSNRGRPKSIPDTIKIDKDGTPICNAGYRMTAWGYDKNKHALKWRCPFATKKVDHCSCICSTSPYGRTVYTKPDWDIRLYPPVTRGTPEYKKIYNNRTSCERINNRILNHYGLHAMYIHTKKHYSFMATIIAICIHLDAWYKKRCPAESTA